MADQSKDALGEAKRIMGNLARMPHKPHVPTKRKDRPASKGRVRKGKSRS